MEKLINQVFEIAQLIQDRDEKSSPAVLTFKERMSLAVEIQRNKILYDIKLNLDGMH